MSDSEDYDSVCGGPIILTEKECAEIDALSALYCLPATPGPDLNPEPTIPEESMPPSVSASALNGLKTLSPFRRFRPNGRLSVTDLVGPTWCEVQFEYGLQQQRSRKLENRPSTFTTRHGKQIAVEKRTAIANDVTLKAGNAVHSALEREIHPDRIVIEARTLEEVWARKLCDMLACIQTLSLSNICREFPVVGFVHGQLVTGIIDEIKRSPCSNTDPDHNTPDTSAPSSISSSRSSSPRVSKRPRGRPRKNPDTQSSDSEASIPTDNSSVHHHPQRHRLFLTDSKTRFSFSLPPPSATLASRLQLMLYRNLLNDLISISIPFDFDKLWQTVGVDSSQTFSETFLTQIQPLLGEDSTITCLKDLEQWWRTTLTGLDLLEKREGVILPVHEQLTIVYRLRSNTVPTSQRKKPRRTSSQPKQRQLTIFESLQAWKSSQTNPLPRCEPSADSQTISDRHTSPVVVEEGTEKAETANLIDSNLTKRAADNEDANDNAEQPDLAVGDIIGQVQFDHDESLLESHIGNVLDWWYGKREPVGVSIEDANRCNACEYISGCEWREKMAKELLTE